MPEKDQQEHNIVFTTLAKSRTVAQAIEEAHRLAQKLEGAWPVEVKIGGKIMYKVFATGEVAAAKDTQS